MKKEDEDMEVPQYDLNDIIEMKKEHPCHKSKQWKIIRMGADIRIKCLGCGSSVLMPRVKFALPRPESPAHWRDRQR